MSAELDKFFEVATPAQDSLTEDQPFKDFLQEVDEMLVHLSQGALEQLSDTNQPQEQELAENLHFHAEPIPVAEADPGFSEMQQTFLAIMQQVLKPVSRYIKAVWHGLDCREIFEVMNFTVAPLAEKVEKVELFEHTADLLQFRATLTRILATHFGTLSQELLKQLTDSFMAVKQAFGLDLRGNQRAVSNILNFYRMLCFSREIEVEDIRKFFAIGIPSLTWVRRTPAGEIASLSGMELGKAKVLRKMAQVFRPLHEVESNPALAAGAAG
jgi:hypothetical protein